MSDTVTLKSHLGDVAMTATLDEFAEFQEYVRAKNSTSLPSFRSMSAQRRKCTS